MKDKHLSAFPIEPLPASCETENAVIGIDLQPPTCLFGICKCHPSIIVRPLKRSNQCVLAQSRYHSKQAALATLADVLTFMPQRICLTAPSTL